MTLELHLPFILSYLLIGLLLAEMVFRFTLKTGKLPRYPAGAYLSAVFLWGLLFPIAVTAVLLQAFGKAK